MAPVTEPACSRDDFGAAGLLNRLRLGSRSLPWLRCFSLGQLLLGKRPGQFGVFAEFAARSHCTLQHHNRLRDRGSYDSRIIGLFGEAMLEGIMAHALSAAFIEGRRCQVRRTLGW
jgi:hypothetical protein